MRSLAWLFILCFNRLPCLRRQGEECFPHIQFLLRNPQHDHLPLLAKTPPSSSATQSPLLLAIWPICSISAPSAQLLLSGSAIRCNTVAVDPIDLQKLEALQSIPASA
ncbi:hypothetical protein DL95DRAFT_386826 [Leptodontidium sp. 2 PMI_412]|nr:hypothetical protein DL95DRAFT_386826 [Leptodontidium sp. 2 PMI_412]